MFGVHASRQFSLQRRVSEGDVEFSAAAALHGRSSGGREAFLPARRLHGMEVGSDPSASVAVGETTGPGPRKRKFVAMPAERSGVANT